MGFRFRYSKQLMPGVRLNMGKKGGSVRLGTKAVGFTAGPLGNLPG
jgi:hypothetical protein